MIDVSFFEKLIKDISSDIQYNVSNQNEYKLDKILEHLNDKNLPNQVSEEFKEFFKAGVNPSFIFFLLNFFKKINSEKIYLSLLENYINFLKTNNKLFLSGVIFNILLLLKSEKNENSILLFINLFSKFENRSESENTPDLLLLISIKNYQLIFLQILIQWYKKYTKDDLVVYLIFWANIEILKNIYKEKFEKFCKCFISEIEQKYLKFIQDKKNNLNQEYKNTFKESQKFIEEYFLNTMN